MAYDYAKLIGKIIEKFKTRSAFASALGISEKSLSSKLRNKLGFRQPEIRKSVELLGIDEAEIGVYFFTVKVQ